MNRSQVASLVEAWFARSRPPPPRRRSAARLHFDGRRRDRGGCAWLLHEPCVCAVFGSLEWLSSIFAVFFQHAISLPRAPVNVMNSCHSADRRYEPINLPLRRRLLLVLHFWDECEAKPAQYPTRVAKKALPLGTGPPTEQRRTITAEGLAHSIRLGGRVAEGEAHRAQALVQFQRLIGGGRVNDDLKAAK